MKKEIVKLLKDIYEIRPCDKIAQKLFKHSCIGMGIDIDYMEDVLMECNTNEKFAISPIIYIERNEDTKTMDILISVVIASLNGHSEEIYNLSNDIVVSNRLYELGYDLDTAIETIKVLYSGKISYC